jgi:hypothetical protein
MSKHILITILLSSGLVFSALAAGESPPPKQNEVQSQKVVRGRDLMSPEELAQHRQKMRSFKTEEERNAYRQEHHKAMQERAKEKGLVLPDQPKQNSNRGMGGGPQGGGGQPN